MAKGYSIYHEEDDRAPSRPSRRTDSHRQTLSRQGEVNHGYSNSTLPSNKRPSDYSGGHYAESPIVMPSGDQRTLAIVNNDRTTSHRSSTLPGRDGRRTRSNSRNRPPGGVTTISKVTRSRSLSSRPAGISVYHPPSYGKHARSTTDVYPIQYGTTSRPATRMSSKSGRSHATGTSAGRTTTKAGVVVETMSAPNPFCPNTRGVCCLMVLVNLALILVAIGFIIVLQLHDPAFVWNIGVVILAFGFFTFFVALVYCMCICQESQHHRPGQPANGELYWTHHWQKNITMPEIKSRDKERWEEQDRFPNDDLSDTSSRDYPRLYLESDYGQRTDREADFETEQEGGHQQGGKTDKYASSTNENVERGKGRY